jgi:hypothetical protein
MPIPKLTDGLALLQTNEPTSVSGMETLIDVTHMSINEEEKLEWQLGNAFEVYGRITVG